jgi:hypothetical protein
VGKVRRIEIMSFRRRAVFEPGGRSVTSRESTFTEIHLKEGNRSDATENETAEFLTRKTEGGPDLMKLMEVFMNAEEAQRAGLNRSRFDSALRFLGLPFRHIKAALKTRRERRELRRSENTKSR